MVARSEKGLHIYLLSLEYVAFERLFFVIALNKPPTEALLYQGSC